MTEVVKEMAVVGDIRNMGDTARFCVRSRLCLIQLH